MRLATFHVSSTECALPLERLREILDPPSVTRVPGASAALRGLANLRGRVIPVLDLAVRLGLPPSAPERPCFLIAESVAAGGPCALAVDGVHAIEEVPDDRVIPPRADVLGAGDWLAGFVDTGGRLLLLLDVERLLDPEAIRAIKPFIVRAGSARAEVARTPIATSTATSTSTATATATAAATAESNPSPAPPLGGEAARAEGDAPPPVPSAAAHPERLDGRTAGSTRPPSPSPGGGRGRVEAREATPLQVRPWPPPRPLPDLPPAPARTSRPAPSSGRRPFGPREAARIVDVSPPLAGAAASDEVRAARRIGFLGVAGALLAVALLALGALAARGVLRPVRSGSPERGTPELRASAAGVTASDSAAARVEPSAERVPAITSAPSPASPEGPRLLPGERVEVAARPPAPGATGHASGEAGALAALPAIRAPAAPTPPPPPAATPAPARAAPPLRPGDVYEVTTGDSLWSISRRMLGDPYSWPDIHAANRRAVRNPDLILPGQRLVVPPRPDPARGAGP